MPQVRVRSVTAVAALLAVQAAGVPAALAAPCWSPPVTAAVADHFRAPACRWCPGNRGIEYATVPGEAVRAIASGEVAFAGSVAGTLYVVVRHADGRRVTYGNLAVTGLQAGDSVTRGSRVGTAAGRFHLGVREGDEYIDPAPYIGELRGVVRLVPVDGSASAPPPPPRLRCPG